MNYAFHNSRNTLKKKSYFPWRTDTQCFEVNCVWCHSIPTTLNVVKIWRVGDWLHLLKNFVHHLIWLSFNTSDWYLYLQAFIRNCLWNSSFKNSFWRQGNIWSGSVGLICFDSVIKNVSLITKILKKFQKCIVLLSIKKKHYNSQYHQWPSVTALQGTTCVV